jgi:transposase
MPHKGHLDFAHARHQRPRPYPATAPSIAARTDNSCRPAPGMRGSVRQSGRNPPPSSVLRSTARRALACEQEATELEARLATLVRQIAQLLDQLGIGPVVAGQMIASWSHHGRVRSGAAFAKLGGATPIEASSGTITRHRLNRSGDRQLNGALHTIVLVRMRQDVATKAIPSTSPS